MNFYCPYSGGVTAAASTLPTFSGTILEEISSTCETSVAKVWSSAKEKFMESLKSSIGCYKDLKLMPTIINIVTYDIHIISYTRSLFETGESDRLAAPRPRDSRQRIRASHAPSWTSRALS